MPTNKISLYSPQGINVNPALNGKWDTPYDLHNLDIEFETGKLRLRDGYVVDTTTIENGISDKLIVANFVGDTARRPYHDLYSIHREESYAHVGQNHTLFIAGEGTANRRINLLTGESTVWRSPQPSGAITVNYGSGKSAFEAFTGTPDQTSVHQFYICYQFEEAATGRVSLPSLAQGFKISINDHPNGTRPATIDLSSFTFNLFTAPSWADRVNYYISRVPAEGYVLQRIRPNRGAFAERIITRDLTTNEVIDQLPFQQTSNDKIGVEELHRMGYELVRIGSRGNVGGTWSSTQTESFTNTGLEYYEPTTGNYQPSISPLSAYELLGTAYGSPPPRNFEHITLYAGRMWGYDRDTNTIRFSFIDGGGVSNYDVFPDLDTPIPHSISLDGMQESTVQAIAVIPGRGGLYVFFRDRIATITGQALVSGLYSAELPPRTDLDASGGIPDVGTASPNSVINFRNALIFLGADKRLWQLQEYNLTNIGDPIQTYLDTISDRALDEVFAFNYNDKYHIIIGSRIFVFDVAKKYWTSYNINIKSAVWDRTENKLLAITNGNELVELYKGNTDKGDPIYWEWESQTITLPDISTICGVYIKVRPPYKPVNLSVIVDGTGVFGGTFTPSYPNRFLQGVYGRGTEFKVILTGSGEPPDIQDIEVEYSS